MDRQECLHDHGPAVGSIDDYRLRPQQLVVVAAVVADSFDER